MRSLVLIAALTTLAAAKPEYYKENEDFQFSRSSTDEGSKSGYYGAQRGNMGGNYERAHNMDGLAQHQMSGAVHQVEGELGDAAKMRTGSVYTAANSRGTYGSGRYNVNNLEGRNFQEGVSYDGSQSQNSQRNSAFRQHSSGSNSNSNSNRYSHSSGQSSSQRSEYQAHEMQSSNLQDDLYRQQEYTGYGDTSRSSQTLYPQHRLVNTRPVRISIRPGTIVAVPVAAQTYNTDHRASKYDSSSYDYNAAKSDAEVIVNNDQETNSRYNNNPRNKHYEQSYSYRKQWEKHDSSPEITPLSIPTESSLQEGSELYDNSQAYNARNHYNQRSGADTHSSQYSSNIKSASNSHRFNHNSQQENLSSGSTSNAHTYDAHNSGIDDDYMRQLANTQTTNTNSMPQSYQSSYSYHKSWERQGDPYVIVPVPSDNKNGQTSQRMSASNAHDSHSSHHYGSQHKQSYQSHSGSNGLDCDDEGHIRVARSYNTDDEFYSQQNQFQSRNFEGHNGWDNLGQQTQNQWENMEDLGQQSQNKFDNLEDHGQQTQNSWDKVEDLGQQSQNKWDNSEDLGQQTHNSWDKVEDLGQQSQNKWDNSEDLGQQTQNKWDKIEDLGQQTQNSWDKFETGGQQSQSKWDKTEDLGQQSYNTWNAGQQTQDKWHNIEDLSQQSQTQWDALKHGQESQSNTDQHQNTWDNSDQSPIHTNTNKFGQENSDQQFEDNWDLRDQVPQNPESFQSPNIHEQEKISNTDTSRITAQNAPQDLKENNYNANLWNKIDFFESNNRHFNRETQNSNGKNYNKPHALNDNTAFDNQHTNKDLINVNTEHHIRPPNHFYDVIQQQNNNYDRHSEFDSTSSNSWYDASSLNNFWNKIDNFDHETSTSFDTSTESDNGSDNTGKNFTHSDHDVYYQEQNKSHSTHSTDRHNQFSTINIDQQSNDSYSEITSTTMKTKDDENILSFPRDIGRGDIGAEDFKSETVSISTQKSHINSDLNTFEVNNHKYKTPEEIEALSLIKEDKTLESSNKTRDTDDVISKPIELSSHASNISKNKNHELEQSPEEINQQSYDQQRHSKYSPNIQTPQEDFEHFDHQNMHQQNMEQNSEDFGQYSQNLNQQIMEQNFVDFEQHSQDKQQTFVDFGQHSQDLSQQNLEDFGQHNQDLNQQNMHQNLEDFGQHSQDLGQQNIEDFGQHNQDLNQQNMQQNLEDFGQHSRDLSQQNLENFGQHSQDLNQQNMHQILEDFGQHSQDLNQQNMQQNLEDFGQHSQDLSQQNIEDFGQHNQDLNQQNMQQNLEDFGQHSQDLNQQNLEDFEQSRQDYQKSNMEQNFEHFEDFNDKNRDLNQQYFHDNAREAENLNEEESVQKIENKHLQVRNFRDHDKNSENTDKTFVSSQQRGRSLDDFEIPHNQVQQLQNINNPKSYSFDDNKQDGDRRIENSELAQQLVEENNVSTSTTPAPVAEKPGFWLSVGNKLSQAKNKISSWFRSS